jgi:MYXO-CTERM domain-containing protein
MALQSLQQRVRYAAVGIGVLCGTTANSAFAGPSWDGDDEADAGQTLATAQVIVTAPAWSMIMVTGRLRGAGLVGSDYVDMYRIHVSSQMYISFSTAAGSLGGSADFDTQLFLFQHKGGSGNNQRAIAHRGNNDAAPGNSGSRLQDPNGEVPNAVRVSPGWYYLAVVGVGTFAFDDESRAIWPNLGNPGDVIDGLGNSLNNWAGEGATGSYAISIRSVNPQNLPSPAALALLGAGTLFSRRRRARTLGA